MNALEIIKTRRSTRGYKKDTVTKELLDQIIEAGRYAPSGGNSQSTHFMVFTNRGAMDELSEIARKEFAKMEVNEDTYRSLASSINQSKSGTYVFHYNAPVLILLANDMNYSNNMADVCCAAENMFIMANALDLGSCYVNQINWLNSNPEVLAFLKKYGLKDNERVYAGLVLGYPNTTDGLPNRTPLERKGNEVTYID